MLDNRCLSGLSLTSPREDKEDEEKKREKRECQRSRSFLRFRFFPPSVVQSSDSSPSIAKAAHGHCSDFSKRRLRQTNGSDPVDAFLFSLAFFPSLALFIALSLWLHTASAGLAHFLCKVCYQLCCSARASALQFSQHVCSPFFPSLHMDHLVSSFVSTPPLRFFRRTARRLCLSSHQISSWPLQQCYI